MLGESQCVQLLYCKTGLKKYNSINEVIDKTDDVEEISRICISNSCNTFSSVPAALSLLTQLSRTHIVIQNVVERSESGSLHNIFQMALSETTTYIE
jgi:hypothetical protein